MAIATVKIGDVVLTVEYSHTPYIPASRNEPAEGGETEYIGIYTSGNLDGLLHAFVHDKIDAAINADIDQRKRDAAEDRAMARAA